MSTLRATSETETTLVDRGHFSDGSVLSVSSGQLFGGPVSASSGQLFDGPVSVSSGQLSDGPVSVSSGQLFGGPVSVSSGQLSDGPVSVSSGQLFDGPVGQLCGGLASPTTTTTTNDNDDDDGDEPSMAEEPESNVGRVKLSIRSLLRIEAGPPPPGSSWGYWPEGAPQPVMMRRNSAAPEDAPVPVILFTGDTVNMRVPAAARPRHERRHLKNCRTRGSVYSERVIAKKRAAAAAAASLLSGGRQEGQALDLTVRKRRARRAQDAGVEDCIKQLHLC